MAQQFEATFKLEAINETEKSEKIRAVQMMLKNFDRDSLVILANKSQKKDINATIKRYQNII